MSSSTSDPGSSRSRVVVVRPEPFFNWEMSVAGAFLIAALFALAVIVAMDNMSASHSSHKYTYTNMEYAFNVERAERVRASWSARGIAAVGISIGTHFLAALCYTATVVLVLRRIAAVLSHFPSAARAVTVASWLMLSGGPIYALAAIGMMSMLLQARVGDGWPVVTGICVIYYLVVLGLSLLAGITGIFLYRFAS
eukprot:c6474_g1_i1.p1 GENE.c6474_g1_i1~~c6474_g1_i1.p1  ORF type:complete len:196 (+),score=23.88 c6474_g1_i1:160-747(+)